MTITEILDKLSANKAERLALGNELYNAWHTSTACPDFALTSDQFEQLRERMPAVTANFKHNLHSGTYTLMTPEEIKIRDLEKKVSELENKLNRNVHYGEPNTIPYNPFDRHIGAFPSTCEAQKIYGAAQGYDLGRATGAQNLKA